MSAGSRTERSRRHSALVLRRVARRVLPPEAARRALTAAALGAGLACHAPAGAQPFERAKACRADVHRLCGSQAPGGGRVVACLQQHEQELSPPCKAELPQMRQCAEQMRHVCGAGRPRELRACLEKNRAQLSACQPGAPQG